MARVIVNELRHLDDRQLAEVEAKFLPRLPGKTVESARKSVKRFAAKIDPDDHRKRRDFARRGRRVWIEPHPDGMADLHAHLPAEDAYRLFGLLTATAGRSALDKADAFVTALGAGLMNPDTGTPPVWQAKIVIDLPTALGLADNPSEVPGYGPLPACVGRALAADATWTRFITDPVTGHLLDLGRTRYTPNAALKEFINERDQQCRFPACTHPADSCDQDHAKTWKTGGHTNPQNLGALSRRHHRTKPSANGPSATPDPTAHGLDVPNRTPLPIQPRTPTRTLTWPDDAGHGGKSAEDFVDEAPAPGFALFDAAHDGVLRFGKVGSGVLSRG